LRAARSAETTRANNATEGVAAGETQILIDVNPATAVIRAELASAYALQDDTARAVAELAEARKLSADDRYMSIAPRSSSASLSAVAKKQAPV
jgi:hypothetical protein